MQNNGKHILKDLKDHEAEPPAFLLDKIKDRIEEEDNAAFKKTFGALANHSIAPAGELFQSINSKLPHSIDDKLKTLKNHKAGAPVSFETILKAAKTNNKAAKVFSIKAYARRIAAAAAVVLIGTAAYFIVQNKLNANTENSNEAIAKTTPAPIKKDPGISSAQPAVTNVAVRQLMAKNTTAAIENNNKEQNVSLSGEQNQSSHFSIDGTDYPVRNNDYLAAFTSFTVETMPAFLTAAKPLATPITIDKYTDINISEGMASILKKTYRTKRNGKPTRKARKQREKIESWKKADSDYFNKNSTNNPLDPMDLGDFILYK